MAVGLVVAVQSVEITLVTAIGVVLSLPLLWRLARGEFDLFEPLTFFIAAWALLFLVRPLAMLQTNTFEILTYPIRDGFVPMLIMALVGAVGFIIGYALPLGRALASRFKAVPAQLSLRKVVAYAVFLTLLGLCLFAAFIIPSGGLDFLRGILAGRQDGQRAQFQQSTAYFYNAIFITYPAALLVIAAGAVRKRIGFVMFGLAILGLAFIEVAPSGYRGWLIPIFAAPIILIYLRRSKRPGLVAVVLTTILAVPTLTFVETARNFNVRANAGTIQLLSDEFSNLSSAWNQLILGGDTEMTSLLALEAITVPSQVNYQHGIATGEILVHPIPRQIWQDKPRPGDEALTIRLFANKGIDYASRTYTPMGNFYLDFGYWGVLLGMILLGTLGRAHYEYLVVNARNLGVQVLYAATLPFWIVLLRDSVTDTAARLLFVVPPLVVGLYLARGTKGKPGALGWPA